MICSSYDSVLIGLPEVLIGARAAEVAAAGPQILRQRRSFRSQSGMKFPLASVHVRVALVVRREVGRSAE